MRQLQRTGLLLTGPREVEQRMVCESQSSPQKPVPPKPCDLSTWKMGGSLKELPDAIERQ